MPEPEFQWRLLRGGLSKDSAFQYDAISLLKDSVAMRCPAAAVSANPWVVLLTEGKGDLLESVQKSMSSQGASAKKVRTVRRSCRVARLC